MKELATDEVLFALSNILKDSRFRYSPQTSAFLVYVVNETLYGRSDRIKAYSIALDALGKPATFDPQSDPSVRVLACRLRKILKQYYSEPNCHKVIIQLNAGTYVPEFFRNSLLVVN